MTSKFFRYSIGFLLLMLILASFYFSKIALFFTSVFFIIIAMNEYRKMFKQKEINIITAIPEIIGIFISSIFIFINDIQEHLFITPIILIGIITTFAITVIRNKKPYLLTSFATIVGFLLILCGLYIIKLTYYFEEKSAWYLVLIYFITVLSGDFIASQVGPKFKKKLAPEISPNKTIGGAVANLIMACIVCLSLKFLINFSIIKCLLLGTTISIFSQIGDLTISTLKRDLGLKHSGSFFLNYGGILDRMDAFIFSAPTAYYCLCLFS